MLTESPIPPPSKSLTSSTLTKAPHNNNLKINITITLLSDPTPAHAPALSAWTSLFGAKQTTLIPHPDLPTFKETYSYPNGRLLLASTPSNPVAGLIAYRNYDSRFDHLRELEDFFVGGGGGGGGTGAGESNGGDENVGKVVEVVRLFVSPSLRHQGIATALVRALVSLARADGVRSMYLHTHPFLPGAERVWEKEGWRVLVREEEGPWWSIHMGRRV